MNIWGVEYWALKSNSLPSIQPHTKECFEMLNKLDRNIFLCMIIDKNNVLIHQTEIWVTEVIIGVNMMN